MASKAHPHQQATVGFVSTLKYRGWIQISVTYLRLGSPEYLSAPEALLALTGSSFLPHSFRFLGFLCLLPRSQGNGQASPFRRPSFLSKVGLLILTPGGVLAFNPKCGLPASDIDGLVLASHCKCGVGLAFLSLEQNN